MRANKLVLDEGSTVLLRTMKTRTGLTHQYLCRLAFGLSLAESEAIDPSQYSEGGLEFNRYTLTGDMDDLFVGLLREWLSERDDADAYSEAKWFRAHINRGLTLLPKRVKTIADFGALVA